MDREQAIGIHKPLIAAAMALDRARVAVADLGKEERQRLDQFLVDVLGGLHLKLLAAIHEQYPDLEPQYNDEETPRIDSTLRWDEVRLPPSVSEADVDAALFSVMKPHWRKVAMVVGQALDRCKELGISSSHEVLAARLQALAEAGRIEDYGDLRMWRFSEVRLKD
jgi:hypothetical protein